MFRIKKIRITAAILFFALITLLFLDFTGTLHCWLGWMAKIQLVPALLAHSVAIVLGIIILTLLFGRVYCSVICPLGIFQDGVSRLSKRRRKGGFRYVRPLRWLRYGALALFVVALVAGAALVVSLLDPYAAYGRMASNFLSPLYYWGNNLLAHFAERMDSYAFYSIDVWLKSGITLGVAVATFFIVGVLAWFNGRIYCNTVCPVGTFLGFISRFSIFKVVFDKEKCTHCKLCERHCKASCIDSKAMHVDYSRCVGCFNCIERCKFDAMRFKTVRPQDRKTVKIVTSYKLQVTGADASRHCEGGSPKQSSEGQGSGLLHCVRNDGNDNSSNAFSRRKVLSIMALLAAGGILKAQHATVDGGLAFIEDKKIPNRNTPIAPPGSLALAHLKQHCTACQLCITACPNNVLRPSDKLSTLMQPEISYERGYCRPECTRCSQVCPAGAIKPITTAEKSAISIGYAVWIKDNCVVNRDNVQCTNCQRHCPTGAIMLVDRNSDGKDSLKIPTIDKERCIGCGACEHLCPARPFSAIYVEGNVQHHTI